MNAMVWMQFSNWWRNATWILATWWKCWGRCRGMMPLVSSLKLAILTIQIFIQVFQVQAIFKGEAFTHCHMGENFTLCVCRISFFIRSKNIFSSFVCSVSLLSFFCFFFADKKKIYVMSLFKNQSRHSFLHIWNVFKIIDKHDDPTVGYWCFCIFCCWHLI